MNLTDLTPSVSVNKIEKQYKAQFVKDIQVSKMSVKESTALYRKTQKLLNEFNSTSNVHKRELDPTYLRIKMVNEAAEMRIAELAKDYHNQFKVDLNKMDKNYVRALKKVVEGASLSKGQINKLNVSTRLKQILESRNASLRFMQKLVEAKKAGKRSIMESEVDTAQTILAAQDIADQVQSMIEKLADVQYKELPALQDSIRNNQGVEAASSFSDTVLDSLQTLTSSLESAKNDLNNAVNVLTGDEVAPVGGDLDLDGLEGEGEGDLELGGDDDIDLGDDEIDLGGEFDMDFDADVEDTDPDFTDPGRDRRDI